MTALNAGGAGRHHAIPAGERRRRGGTACLDARAVAKSAREVHLTMARPGLKVRLARTLQVRLINPRKKRTAGLPGAPGALLETVGRKSGKRRQAPVLNGLDGDTFWIVSMFGRQAHYVRNILAQPRVRVKVGGSWREGTARVVEDDDAKARIARLDPDSESAARRFGTDLLTVRVDLDPQAS